MEYLDLVNEALQKIGTRTTVTQNELDNNSTNEAIQANLIIHSFRDRLMRMAPWNCARGYMSLVPITSQPGTWFNQSPAPSVWSRGLPPPPWIWEYQYPSDCLRPCFIFPTSMTEFTGGVPIFPVTTGAAAWLWEGAPIKYAIATDDFTIATGATVANGGSGYAVGDFIVLNGGSVDSAPIGAPAVMSVTGVDPGGVITSVFVYSQVYGQNNPVYGGSYFEQQTAAQTINYSSGSGTGATFLLTWGGSGKQRVVLTNQEYAGLSYIKITTNVNVWDSLFQNAYVSVLASGLAMALNGDRAIVKTMIEDANNDIMTARTADGNEGLTINDVTPDWIRARGIDYPNQVPPFGWSSFNWGPLWTG